MDQHVNRGVHGIAYVMPYRGNSPDSKGRRELLVLAVQCYGHLLPRFKSISYEAFADLVKQVYAIVVPHHKAMFDALQAAHEEALLVGKSLSA